MRKALVNYPRNQYIVSDLGYILGDEGRFKEAAEMFQIAVEETPGSESEYYYKEPAECYEEIGETDKAAKYKDIFTQKNNMRLLKQSKNGIE